jgi:hypothetical protein
LGLPTIIEGRPPMNELQRLATMRAPVTLLSASALICEKVLNEADNVLSAIRLVDIFKFVPVPNVPVEQRPVVITILVITRFMAAEGSEQTFDLELVRPNGETRPIGERFVAKIIPNEVPGAPAGVNIVVQIGVIPKQMGLHFVRVLFNGNELAKASFTLAELKGEVVQQQPV